MYPGKTSTADAGGKTSFCVHDKLSMKLLEERMYRPGFVRWSTASTLEYQDMPGAIRGDQKESDFIKTIRFKAPEKL